MLQVKRACGSPKLSEKEDPTLVEVSTISPTPSGKPRTSSPRQFVQPPDSQLIQFLNSMGKSKRFYGNLADSLCYDENFAQPKDQHCWNGERIGE